MSASKMGNLRKIENTGRRYGNECQVYWSVLVEDESGAGDTERYLMFTPLELEKLPVWDCGEWGKSLKRGRLYPCGLEGRGGHILPVNYGGDDITLYVSRHMLERSGKRAGNNPEDQPKRSWWRGLLD